MNTSVLEPFRWIVGKGVLLYERLTRETPIVRGADDQAAVNDTCAKLILYEFRACPFCMKVRKVTHRKALPIELRDARRNAQWGEELRQRGGKFQVPCLRITADDGTETWLYESSAVIERLNQQFPDPS